MWMAGWGLLLAALLPLVLVRPAARAPVPVRARRAQSPRRRR